MFVIICCIFCERQCCACTVFCLLLVSDVLVMSNNTYSWLFYCFQNSNIMQLALLLVSKGQYETVSFSVIMLIKASCLVFAV